LKQLLLIIAIIIPVAIVYMKVPCTYFCAYDDFIEIHRAAFEDSADHSRIVTTAHFNSYKYRPLNRAVNFLTYRASDFRPEVFRTKNLAFHLVNVVLIYLLGWKLFGSIPISAMAALFFGLHPIANQTIVGAVDTNSMSHAAFIGALLMLIRSMDSAHWAMWLAGSVLIGWVSLIAYDSNIVVFGLMYLWIILNWVTIRKCIHHRRLITLFTALSGSLLTIYFLLRHLYVPQGITGAAPDLLSAGVILRNVTMYIGALLLPVDVVLANEWLNTPLPSEIQFHVSSPVVIVTLLSLMGMAGILFLRWRRTHLNGANYIAVIFLVVGIVLPLLPVLLFQPRPSETYLYLPVGFYSLLLSFGLVRVWSDAGDTKLWRFYVPTTVIVLIVLFSSATWVRNNRVFHCGETARRILDGLPDKLLRTGRWKVLFVNIPGENRTRRYGFYGFRGVDTIGHGLSADWAVTSALQLVYKNELLTGEVIEPQQLNLKCRTGEELGQICALVHSDGRIKIVTPN
jgi:hypothetical protein